MLDSSPSPALRILSSGMCCSVGFSGPAARVAIRARLDRFQTSHFLDARAEPLVVADVPFGDLRGSERLAAMCAEVVAECLAGAPGDVSPAATALFLLMSEPDRPGHNPAWEGACLAACRRPTFHPESRLFRTGRAGIGEALRAAGSLLAGRPPLPGDPAQPSVPVRHVLVAGVDSYLHGHTINHFLSAGRLLGSAASDGFIPGEGAGALLLQQAGPAAPGLHILGIGTADEPARPDNDEPARATGRTQAIRGALAESGLRMSDLHFQVADLNGEPFFTHELAMATTRVFDRKLDSFPLLCLAESLGDTGAAAGPLSLAYLLGAMERGHTPGARAILHFANDDGRRASLVVEDRRTPPAPLPR